MNEPFVYGNGRTAFDGKELLLLCREFPEASLKYLLRADFEKWLEYIGDRTLAQYAAEVRKKDYPEAQKLACFIKKVEYITEPETIHDTLKPKVSFFTAIATFFLVLFHRPDKTKDRPANT